MGCSPLPATGGGAGVGVMVVGGDKLLLAEDPPQPVTPSADNAADPFRTVRRERGRHLGRG